MSQRRILRLILVAVLAAAPVAANPSQLLTAKSQQVGASFQPSISQDGRYVAFSSTAPTWRPARWTLSSKPTSSCGTATRAW